MTRYPDAPGHRNVDTSIAAADDLAPRLGHLQRLGNLTIHSAGEAGLTAEELSARLGLERTTMQPRTTELSRKGLIRDSGRRRRNASGKAAIVWIAVPKSEVSQ